MNSDMEIKSTLSIDNTINNLVKNQESESTMYIDNDTTSTSSEDDCINKNKNVQYIIFSKLTKKSIILSIIASIVLCILVIYIIKHYIKK